MAPAASMPVLVSGYATASGAEPEVGAGHALGGSGGFIFERSRMLALDLRGAILTARVPVHTYLAAIGPRLGPSYGRLRPYGEVLAGMAHTDVRLPSGVGRGAGFGFTWTVAGGLDLRLTHHIEWRVAEYTYSHIYTGTGASPTILNTGIVYRI